MKDIPGFEGQYAITSCGRVWSYISNRFLKPHSDNNGYLRYRMAGKSYSAHRLVALTYIPNPENLPEVNHKDEIKTHNYINNLEWCNRKYNCNYGTKNDWCKKKVKCIETGEIFESITAAEIAEKGKFTGALSHCLKGETKTFNKKHWEMIK